MRILFYRNNAPNRYKWAIKRVPRKQILIFAGPLFILIQPNYYKTNPKEVK